MPGTVAAIRNRASLLAAGVVLVAGTAFAKDINVDGPRQLASALSSADGGDTILLGSGRYGDVAFREGYSERVTIKPAAGADPVFDTVRFSNASNIRLEGVKVHPANPANRIVEITKGDWSDHIELVGLDVRGPAGSYTGAGIHVQDASNILLHGNSVQNIDVGFQMFTVNGLRVSENRVDYINSDSYKFSTIDGAVIENNWGARHLPTSEEHQDFIQFQGENGSKNVVIRGNVSIPAAGQDATTQGIFSSEVSLRNFEIQENIIFAGIPQGINMPNAVIRNNTVLHIPPPEGAHAEAWIKGDGATIENNIWTVPGGGALEGSNLKVQWAAGRGAPYHVSGVFRDFQGAGTPLEGLLPVPGGGAEGRGAHARLLELLAQKK